MKSKKQHLEQLAATIAAFFANTEHEVKVEPHLHVPNGTFKALVYAAGTKWLFTMQGRLNAINPDLVEVYRYKSMQSRYMHPHCNLDAGRKITPFEAPKRKARKKAATQREERTVVVWTVKEVEGHLPSHLWNQHFNDRYGSRLVRNRTKARRLEVYFIDSETGETGHFFTPTVLINTASGFINYERLEGDGKGWFAMEQGEHVGHKNALSYEGNRHREPAVAIEDTSKVVHAIQPGDEITIKGTRKGKSKTVQLNRVVRLDYSTNNNQ